MLTHLNPNEQSSISKANSLWNKLSMESLSQINIRVTQLLINHIIFKIEEFKYSKIVDILEALAKDEDEVDYEEIDKIIRLEKKERGGLAAHVIQLNQDIFKAQIEKQMRSSNPELKLDKKEITFIISQLKKFPYTDTVQKLKSLASDSLLFSKSTNHHELLQNFNKVCASVANHLLAIEKKYDIDLILQKSEDFPRHINQIKENLAAAT